MLRRIVMIVLIQTILTRASLHLLRTDCKKRTKFYLYYRECEIVGAETESNYFHPILYPITSSL